MRFLLLLPLVGHAVTKMKGQFPNPVVGEFSGVYEKAKTQYGSFESCKDQPKIGPTMVMWGRNGCEYGETKDGMSQKKADELLGTGNMPGVAYESSCMESGDYLSGTWTEFDHRLGEFGWEACYCIGFKTRKDSKKYTMYWGWLEGKCEDVGSKCPDVEDFRSYMMDEDEDAADARMEELGWMDPGHKDYDCVYGCQQTCSVLDAQFPALKNPAKLPPVLTGRWRSLEDDGDRWRRGCRLVTHLTEKGVGYEYMDVSEEETCADAQIVMGPNEFKYASCYQTKEGEIYGRVAEEDIFYDPKWDYPGSCTCWYYSKKGKDANIRGVWGYMDKNGVDDCDKRCPDAMSSDFFIPISFVMKYGSTYEMECMEEEGKSMCGPFTCGDVRGDGPSCGDKIKTKIKSEPVVKKMKKVGTACDCMKACQAMDVTEVGAWSYDPKKKNCLCHSHEAKMQKVMDAKKFFLGGVFED